MHAERRGEGQRQTEGAQTVQSDPLRLIRERERLFKDVARGHRGGGRVPTFERSVSELGKALEGISERGLMERARALTDASRYAWALERHEKQLASERDELIGQCREAEGRSAGHLKTLQSHNQQLRAYKPGGLKGFLAAPLNWVVPGRRRAISQLRGGIAENAEAVGRADSDGRWAESSAGEVNARIHAAERLRGSFDKARTRTLTEIIDSTAGAYWALGERLHSDDALKREFDDMLMAKKIAPTVEQLRREGRFSDLQAAEYIQLVKDGLREGVYCDFGTPEDAVERKTVRRERMEELEEVALAANTGNLRGMREALTSHGENPWKAYDGMIDLLVGEAARVKLNGFMKVCEKSGMIAPQVEAVRAGITGALTESEYGMPPLDVIAASSKDINDTLRDAERWRIVGESPRMREAVGDDVIGSLSARLAEKTLSELLVEREHKDHTIRLGERLAEHRTVETIPLTIVNFFREPGYSGENTFISIHEAEPADTIAAQYVSSLTPDELRQLRAKNIPGLMEVIAAVKQNSTPQTDFRKREVPDPKYAALVESAAREHDTGSGSAERRLKALVAEASGHGAKAREARREFTGECRRAGVEPAEVEGILSSDDWNAAQVPNPAYQVVQDNLARMCMHYLEHGSSNERIFVLGMLERVDADLSQHHKAMGRVLRESDDPRVQNALVERIVTRGEHKSSKAETIMILRSFESLSPDVQEIVRAKKDGILKISMHEELGDAEITALSAMTGRSVSDVRLVNSFLRLANENAEYYNERLDVDGDESFDNALAIAKTQGATGLIRELRAYGYSPKLEHAAVIPEMASDRNRLLDGVRTLSELMGESYRYQPEEEMKYNPDTQRTDYTYYWDPYKSLMKEKKPFDIFVALEAKRHADGGISRKYTDGMLRQLKSGRPAEGDYTEFNSALNTLLPAFFAEGGRLKESQNLVTAGFMSGLAKDPAGYAQKAVDYGVMCSGFLGTVSENEKLKNLSPGGKIAELLSRPREELEALTELVRGGADPTHLLTGLVVAWPVASQPGNLLESAKTVGKMLKKGSGNQTNMLVEGLGFFVGNGSVTDTQSLKQIGLGVSEVTQRNASNEVWDFMVKCMPRQQQDEQLPARDTPKELETFRDFVGEFGVTNIPYVYTAFHRMHAGMSPPEEITSSGITEAGAKGISQLRRALADFRRQVIEDDRSITVTNQLERDLLIGLTRFSESQWSRGEQIESVASQLGQDIAGGLIPDVAPEFERGTIKADKIDAKSRAEFTFADDTKIIMGNIREDVRAVAGKPVDVVAAEQKQQLVGGLNAKIEEIETETRQAREEGKDAKVKGLGFKAQKYRKFQEAVADRNSIPGLIEAIALNESKDDPVTTPVLRRLLIRHGLEELPSGGREFIQAVESPLSEGIGHVLEYYDSLLRKHILGTNPELSGRLELPKKARKRAQAVVSQPLLRQENKRFNSIESTGEEEFLMIPSRGLLGELSGSICDACWTSQSNIIRENPNMTPVVFVRSPNTPGERIAGATLLLEGKTAEGEDVMIIRGFNPLQNIITGVKSESFFESFVDWLEPIARKKGAKKILIVGGVRGGAMTNRPDIATYVSGAYGDAQRVALADEPNTTFNGYDIRGACKVVRDLT